MTTMGLSVPSIDIRAAIRMYYERIELSTADIKQIFGGEASNYALRRLKKAARDKLATSDEIIWDAKKINTRVAYEAWGLEIAELEQRYARLKKLGLLENAG